MSNQKKVLIVDDSRLSRMMLSKIISNSYPDWVLDEAANGDEALSKAAQQQYDFVTLDNNMPGRSGMETFGELRVLLPNAKIGMFSANVQQKVVEQATKQGLQFISKPLTEDKVINFLSDGD